MSKQTICLNMIVKNESHIIETTLVNILENVKIDYWVISDTGSTDNTVDIITSFFEKRNIPGEIFHDEWRDFGYNRTKALEHAYNKTDFLFIFDADDLIHGTIPFPEILDKEEYSLNFDGSSYTRRILISNRRKWKYIGVLHEILKRAEDKPYTYEYLRGNYHIESRRLGARNHNPHKYRDDGIVLEKAIENEKDRGLRQRYIFYCGQSYECAGSEYNDKAIKYAEMNLKEGTCNQHKFNSCIRLANIYKNMGDIGKFLLYNNKSTMYDKNRLEGIASNMQYYYDNRMHLQVSMYYNYFKDYKIDNKNLKLFYKQHKYNDFYWLNSISASYIRNKEYKKTGYDCCKYILLNSNLFSLSRVDQTILNFAFYQEFFKTDENNNELIEWFINYMKNNCNKDEMRVKKIREYCNNISSKFSKELEEVDKLLKLNVIKKDEYSKSKNILIYTGWMTHLWNESHLEKKALGGSEKAVAYLSRELPKEYNIIISGEVEEGTFDNRRYVHVSKLQSILDNTEFKTVIVSRNIDFLTKYNNIKCFQLILSLHDTHILSQGKNANEILNRYNKYIDTVITLTPWHKSNIIKLHPSIPSNKIEIINNGIDISQFLKTNKINNESVKKIKNKFVWSSRTERGLHIVLNLWNEILEKLPDATLDICSYGKFPKDKEDEKMLEIINKHSSITYHGKLNTKELYNLMSISEYWLYTSTFPETSCITAMEMLMSGVICLYYPLAGLVDTIGSYGIQVKSGNEVESLIDLSEERKKELIKNGKEYALTCSWKNRAVQWIDILLNEYSVSNERIEHLHTNFTLPVDHINFLKKLGSEFEPNVIYDIGANVLNWTKEAKQIWNSSEIIVFDAVKSFGNFYKNKGYKYYTGVLSDSDNKFVKFYQNKEHPAGNSYYKEIGHKNSHIIYPESNYTNEKTITLSSVVKNLEFPMPDLIKFDVQGAELDIIKGSLDIINHAKYLIVEIQNKQYNKNAPLLNETVDFLEMNGWELVTKKPFCNNGPDGDYCFKKKYKKKWVFYCAPHYETRMINQYIDNLNCSNPNYVIYLTNDKDKILTENPAKITFVYEVFDNDILNKLPNTQFSFLNTEPLNIDVRLQNAINILKLYPNFEYYDYSESNLKILKEKRFNITNNTYLPYKCNNDELKKLTDFNKNTKKEFDFGILKASGGIITHRRSLVIDYLKENNFTVNIVDGWGDDRDLELAKCKIILNVHGILNTTISKIFEHIRCDRLLEAGFTILSETSYELDEEFVNKYPNLKQISYDDFFNIDVISSMLHKKNICFIHSCHLKDKGLKRLEYLVEKIKDSGLIKHLETIYINNIGIPIKGPKERNGGKIKICNYSDNPQLYEIPTINKILDFSKKNIHCNILYLHTKGVSHYNDNKKENDWIDMMLYFLVEKFELCLEKMNNGIQAVGCNYYDEKIKIRNPKHFSGNFWWADSQYISKLPYLIEKTEKVNPNDAEFWLCKNNPSFYELHNSKTNHYMGRYHYSLYRDSLLTEIVDNRRTDKNTRHSYLQLYEKLLNRLKNTSGNVLEIGIGEGNEVCNGGSIKLWHDYFKNASIYALDIINIDTYKYGWDSKWWHKNLLNNDRVILYTSTDAYDINNINRLFTNNNKQFDFIIDDGPHTLESMKIFIKNYTNLLTDNGILIIEDIQDPKWLSILSNCVPNNLKQYIFTYDLRHIKNRYDDIVFCVDKNGYNIKPKIIDCFTFYNEIEILTYRLNVLDEIVDYFILVESTHTFVGKEKPLFYQENKHLFEKFNHKIIHVVVDDFPHKFPNIDISKGEQWINERFQRDCISRGLDKLSLKNDDIITITDLDEIPNPNVLEKFKNNEISVDVNIIKMDFYYYNLNSKMDHDWFHAKVLTFKKYNELKISCEKIRFYKCPIINNGGWHLSYFGDVNFVKNKIQNFSHQELNNDSFATEEKIKERMDNKIDNNGNKIIDIKIEDNNNLPPDYDTYLTKFYNDSTLVEKNLDNFKYENYPYGHIIIDDFLKTDVAEKALNEINNLSDESACGWFNPPTKWEYNKGYWENLDNIPITIKDIFTELLSREFINKLEKLTGINGLIAGEIFRGTSIHRINNGGYLGLHTDFNSYNMEGVGKLDRRINLLIYMNKDWKLEYGGQFDLCDLENKKCIKRINPDFNRCAIFNTSSKSIHGHPEPLNLPKGTRRQSIAIYYYTKNTNGDQDFEGYKSHGTLWHDKKDFDYTDAKIV